jgi:mercuric ion binding protein
MEIKMQIGNQKEEIKKFKKMKTIKNIMATGMMFLLFAFSGKETKTIEIKTSTVCDMCKDRIERDLVFETGVKSVKVDLKVNIITVKYRTDKTNPETIKKAISKLGYWADEVAASEEAFNKLPDCCKKEGCGKKTE